ncbi:MAG: cadherin repeat domain-containing protein, partial [Gammaproteobacteria bacterium]
MAIAWKITPPSGESFVENDGIAGFAVGQFTAFDDTNTITYELASGATDYFSITADGQLNLISAFDADNAIDGIFSVVVKAISTDSSNVTSTITSTFIISANNINENPTEWDGRQDSLLTVNEITGVENLRFDLTTSEYEAVTTFTPKDADGDEFGYFIAGEYAWMFEIDSKGVLKLKYGLDYESVWFDTTNFAVTIWAWGIDGGDPVGDATAVSQNFVLEVANVNEDNINDQPTTWSGTPPTSLAVSETEGVNGGSELTTATYEDLVTFTPLDDDGTNFNYFIAGEQAWLFDIGTDGVLKLKYQLDYESLWYPATIPITIYAWGTDGGDAVGDATAVSQNFVLSVLNINEDNINDSSISWAGVSASAAISE